MASVMINRPRQVLHEEIKVSCIFNGAIATIVTIMLLVYYFCKDSLERLIDNYFKPSYASS